MEYEGRELSGQISGIAALDEPVRRRLYEYVAAQAGPVSRDQAAQGAGVSRALAAFHLDRLVDEGLLETEYRRLTGRTGPGAGRPSKLYRRSGREIQISLPPRSYELAARLFAETLAETQSPEVQSRLKDLARSFGEGLGARTAEDVQGDMIHRAEAGLAASGYEPRTEEDGSIRLRNCPFHALAAEHRGLVCGMNLSLMEGFVSGLEASGLTAVLDPQPGMCCVRLQPDRE